MGKWVKPKRLESGMTIGVMSPSSGARNERLEAGIAILESSGYRVALGDHVFDRHGYLAGTDSARALDFTQMFERSDVDAILCARGGYGASRILSLVNWDVVVANPKIFVGYSDITTLHLALERRAQMVTLYGPMAASFGGGLSAESARSFWSAITSTAPAGTVDTGVVTVRSLVGGKSKGRLAGGCVALLAAAVATADAPDFERRIVLLEDVDEAAYRVDRYLMQLLHAGLLQRAAGFVIGNVTDWEKHEKTPPAITLSDVWHDLIAPLGKPTITGLPFGHEPNPLTLPLGCLAELDADSGTLTLLESAVV